MEHLKLFEDYRGKKLVLYIHGLDSHPHKDRIVAMKASDVSVVAPLFHYREKPVWGMLVEIMETQMPDAIVGFSIGGYLGLHLSDKFEVPALLFSPAIVDAKKENLIPPDLQPIPADVLKLMPFKGKMAVISPKDELLDFDKLKTALEGRAEIVVDAAMEHRTPTWAVEKYFPKFYEKYL